MDTTAISTTRVHLVDLETAATIYLALMALETDIDNMLTLYRKTGNKSSILLKRHMYGKQQLKKAMELLHEYDVEALVKATDSFIHPPKTLLP